MVTFTLISDLHLQTPTNWQTFIKNTSTDYLILAGDICRITKMDILLEFLTSVCLLPFKKVVYVCGNHEFYNKQGYTYCGLLAILREKTRQLEKLVILNNEIINIEQNLRIFGTTLWSQLPDEWAGPILPIFDENGLVVTRNWMHREHFTALHKLDTEILRARVENKRLIVVSHYAPTFENTLKPEHYQTKQRFFYCSPLDQYLYKSKIYTWMFGHTHVNVDYLTRGDTRLVTNQYPGEGFDNGKIISIRDNSPTPNIIFN